MQIARERFNPYAQAVEEAQGDIRMLVKRAYLYGITQGEVNRELEKIIRKATQDVVIATLKSDIRISLINFANRQRGLWQSIRIGPELLLLLGKVVGSNNLSVISKQVQAELERITQYDAHAMRVPLDRYYQEVWKESVKPTLDKIARAQALDPNDFTGRNSLRNLAEMEVRYHDHQDSIESLRNDGVRLVVCSAHADCSKRCSEWQGRIYSLDGTSGVADGHRYVPLEVVTDIWYTTKAGRRYKNGLLGFNCRHKLSPYKGQLLPTVSAEERKKEYAITQRQRELEKLVRNAKAQALDNKGINDKDYKKYNKQAQELYAQYIRFSADNHRAYYPMRVKI